LEEKGDGGAEFEVVREAEDLLDGAAWDLVDERGAFAQTRAEDGLGEVGAGFVERANGKVLCRWAVAEAAKLRKDEPHPVRRFAAGAEFSEDAAVDIGLGVEKALELERIGHGEMAEREILAARRKGSKRGADFLAGMI
jgi:hypothetical protein